MTRIADLRTQLKDWQRLFDRRKPRERLMLIGAAAAIAFLLVDALLLGPALTTWRAAVKKQNAAQLATVAQQTDLARRRADLNNLLLQKQAELDSWRRRVREGEAALQEHESALVGPDRMVALLEQMLAQRGQVRLRSMQSLPRTDLLPSEAGTATAGGAQPTATAAAAAASATLPAGTSQGAAAGSSLFRHGVELTVEGSFAELLDYLHALEAMPQRVLWGKLAFKVEQYPKASLTLRLYTVSRERHWLEI